MSFEKGLLMLEKVLYQDLKKFFLIGGKLLYSVVLVSVVETGKSAIILLYIHIYVYVYIDISPPS